MTVFLVDLSHYQPDNCVDLARAQGYAGCWIKCTEGSSYVDPSFASKLARARALRFPVATYPFITSASVASQVANILRVVPKDVPVWPDVEGGVPLAQGAAIGDALRDAGYVVPGMYHSTRPPAGYAWWRAHYNTDPAGAASATYPGDTSSDWVGQDLWQFGSKGRLAGYPGDVDVTAFRGTRSQLLAKGWFWTGNNNGIPHATRDEDPMILLHDSTTGAVWMVGPSGKWHIPSPDVLTALVASVELVEPAAVTQAMLEAHIAHTTPATLAGIPDATPSTTDTARHAALLAAIAAIPGAPPLDVPALAAAIAAAIPLTEVTTQVVEQALRDVLGSLDNPA